MIHILCTIIIVLVAILAAISIIKLNIHHISESIVLPEYFSKDLIHEHKIKSMELYDVSLNYIQQISEKDDILIHSFQRMYGETYKNIIYSRMDLEYILTDTKYEKKMQDLLKQLLHDLSYVSRLSEYFYSKQSKRYQRLISEAQQTREMISEYRFDEASIKMNLFISFISKSIGKFNIFHVAWNDYLDRINNHSKVSFINEMEREKNQRECKACDAKQEYWWKAWCPLYQLFWRKVLRNLEKSIKLCKEFARQFNEAAIKHQDIMNMLKKYMDEIKFIIQKFEKIDDELKKTEEALKDSYNLTRNWKNATKITLKCFVQNMFRRIDMFIYGCTTMRSLCDVENSNQIMTHI